ncbi:MAG: DNA polymerase III subunit delta [Actinomycetes bacterium]
MASFKVSYLIHGDDHGRIGERRSNLRKLAEGEAGEGGVEMLEGEAATPDATVTAVLSMSLTVGRRFVIVDGVERWKAADTEELEGVLLDMPLDTTLALFAREDGRAKVHKSLIEAVEKGGGAIAVESQVKPWDLPDWVRERARELGFAIDPTAARELIATVGERQQRLQRELEKIALSLEPGAKADSDTVSEMAAGSAERKVWSLADSLIAGQGRRAIRNWLELEAQGERSGALVGIGARRLREAIALAERLDQGESPASVRKGMRMPPKAADAFLRDIRQTDAEALRDRLSALADLEVVTRGGGRPMSEGTAVAGAFDSMFGQAS